MAKVLILDQSKSMRNTLRERLEFEGFSTEAAEDEEAASTMCEKIPFDVILSDTGCKIPDKGVPFIVLSSEASIDSAVEAVRNGAQDYLTKPIDMNRLLQSIHRTIDNPAPAPACAPAAAPARRSRRSRNMHTEQIIGTSPQMEHVRQLIDKVAPCEARVLITGENGTGKELVARWLHAKSNRAAAPFVEVNCAAIPSELIESELFGHERGAFTSAIKQRRGKFEQADGGTLFMDEIGDMSLAAQAKVLRALQENKICRVGSDKDIDVDVRVIAASNIPLETLVEAGQFRSDLYYRLNVIRIQAPTLRERKEDLPLLVDNFIHRLNYQLGMVIEGVAPGAMDLLMDYDWPGNVRELQNAVESAMNAADSPILRRRDFRQLEQRMQARRRRQLTGPGDFKLRPARQAFERELIRDALAAAGGNRVKAAALLDISRTVLYEKMEQYQLK